MWKCQFGMFIEYFHWAHSSDAHIKLSATCVIILQKNLAINAIYPVLVGNLIKLDEPLFLCNTAHDKVKTTLDEQYFRICHISKFYSSTNN
jgi:hypothetical protein